MDIIHCGVPAARRQACTTMHTQTVNGPDENRVLSVRFQVAMLHVHGRSTVSIERDGLGIQAPKAGRQAGRHAGRQAGRKKRCRQTYRFVVPFERFHAGCTITYSPSLMDATGSFVSACEQHRQESARYECAVRGVDRTTTEHHAPIDQPPNTMHQ